MNSSFTWSFLLFFLVFHFSGFFNLSEGNETPEVREVSVSRAINDMGWRLFPKLVTRSLSDISCGNLVYSPLSVMLALSMVYLGAANTTASEIENVFFDNHVVDMIEFHKQWKVLIGSMPINDFNRVLPTGNKMNLANGLWFRRYFNQVQTQYKHEIKQYYNALIRAVDFSRRDSIDEINSWVNFKTEGKIQSVIEADAVNEDTVLMLTNVLYFKGLWQETFLAEDTYDSQFIINATSAVNIKMMKKKSIYDFYYDDVLKLQVLKLPYRNGTVAMFIALPQELDSLSRIHTILSSTQIDTWENSLYQTRVYVHLPKFILTATYKLEQVMAELGIAELFDKKRANLSGISLAHQFYVSSFVHKASIEVHEQGTEASAASAMHVTKRSLDPEFIADHSFIFWIRHIETKAILFSGQLAVPGIETESINYIDLSKRHSEL